MLDDSAHSMNKSIWLFLKYFRPSFKLCNELIPNIIEEIYNLTTVKYPNTSIISI